MSAETKQGGIVRGGEDTSHANDGVKYVVKSTGQHVELEGDEIVLCENLMKSDKFFTFTDTPLNIIKTLADEYGCKRGSLTEIQGGEFVICKKVVRDNTPITVSGTPPDIISQLQIEKGCNVHWSWDIDKVPNQSSSMEKGGETCDVCEHEAEELKNGGGFKKGNGDCFMVSAKAMLDHYWGSGRKYQGEPFVVHAEVIGQGELSGMPFAHGWIEDDVFVYDFANGNEVTVPKSLYYELGDVKTDDPKKYRRYSEEQLMNKMTEHNTYGCWDIDTEFEDGGIIPVHTEVEKFYLLGIGFDVAKIYAGIKSGKIPYQLETVATYNPSDKGIHISDEIIQENASKSIDTTKPTGLWVAFNINGELMVIAIDGNHKMYRLHEDGVKSTTIIMVTDIDAIKKNMDVAARYKKRMTAYVVDKMESGGNVATAEEIAERYGLKEPKSTWDIEADIQDILSHYKSRTYASYVAEKYLSELADKELVKKFFSENNIATRADLKEYCRSHQFKARYGVVIGAKRKSDAEISELEKQEREAYFKKWGFYPAEKIEFEEGGIIPSDSKLVYFYEPDTMMPMNSTFQNDTLYHTSVPMFEQGGTIEDAAFKKWFGKSKMVDKQGKPLVVYHGTQKSFSKFRKDFFGTAHGAAPSNMAGVHFTDNKDVAKTYGKNVIAAYIIVKKPIILDAHGKDYSAYKHEVNLATEKMLASDSDGIFILNYKDAGIYGDDAIKSNNYIVKDIHNIAILSDKLEKGGFISKSSSDTLAKIRELRLHEIDYRFSDFIREKYVDELNKAEGLLLGNIKVLSSAEQDGYKIITMDDADELTRRQHFVFKKGLEHMPVPAGFWMDFWEKDHEKYFKIDKRQYNEMDLKERALLENKLQLKLWAKKQYWLLFAEFYMPAEHANWYWEEGGYHLPLGGQCAYWNEKMENDFEEQVKKFAAGGAIAEKPTKKEMEARWDKKKDHIMRLASVLRKLRYNLTADMKSDNEKDRLTALVIAIMDKSGERVGNDESAAEGRVGITGLKKKHITIEGNKIFLDYTGKSGVDQDKSFSDELIAKKLSEAIANTPDSFVFTTTDGFKIKDDRVGRYLDDFGINPKDIRGFYSNQHIIKKLKTHPAAEEEKDRIKQFREAVKYAAAKVGHGAATLKNHYMIPELEKAFITKGEIIDLADFYKTGGIVKMASGGYVEVDAVSGMPSHVWARAAAGVLLVAYDTGRCLFLKRSTLIPEGEKWGIVSGGIEKGETPTNAIRREMQEELGHEEDIIFNLAYVHDSKDEDFGFYNFIGAVEKEFQPTLNYEHSEYKWVPYDDIPTPLHFGVAEFLHHVNLKTELQYALEKYMRYMPHEKE